MGGSVYKKDNTPVRKTGNCIQCSIRTRDNSRSVQKDKALPPAIILISIPLSSKVSSLEPFLEALPSLSVMIYISLANPDPELIFVTNITNYICGEKNSMWGNFGKFLEISRNFGRFCHNLRAFTLRKIEPKKCICGEKNTNKRSAVGGNIHQV